MNYFIDTEFLEGTQKENFPISLFRKETKPTIDLISIGIVSEDGREYYAISKDFNLEEAWYRYQMKQVYGDARNLYPYGVREFWIRENVLKPIWLDLLFKSISSFPDKNEIRKMKLGDYDKHFTYSSFKNLLNKYGKSNKDIAEEIKIFIANRPDNKTHKDILENEYLRDKPTFYGYYADYDWVVFCWLFGKMIDLPKGFPMYCNDLKQMLDEKENSLRNKNGKIELISEIIPEHGCAMSAEFDSIKDFGNYPQQKNEHNALADARWNKKLYEFLKNV